MASEVRQYTAKQVAEAVLKTAHDLLAKNDLAKAEKNPDKNQDAKLGEDVEHLCESHMIANKDAERAEGHKIVKSDMDRCHTCKMHKGGMSAEQMKHKLIKHGLSPNQVMSRMKKHEEFMATMAKYETMNSKKLGYKLPEAGKNEKESERTDKDYEVKPDAPANALGPKSPASHSHPEVQKSEVEILEELSKAETDRLRPQTNPMTNPKEQAEGNNELAGTTPTQVNQAGKNIPGFDEMRGHLKLAKFIGRMDHKRSLAKAAPMAMGEGGMRHPTQKDVALHPSKGSGFVTGRSPMGQDVRHGLKGEAKEQAKENLAAQRSRPPASAKSGMGKKEK